MTPASDTAAWGVDVRAIEVARHNALGEQTFRLKLTRPLQLKAGAGGLNRLPVMGPSGAGKSTFLNLLSCTSFPQTGEGEVSWTFPDGYSCKWGARGPGRDTLIRLRQQYFGYAFQTASLQPQLTIGENLTFGLENTGEYSAAQARARALEVLIKAFSGNELRARNIFDRYDTEISGGERQRISLMQAMIRDPYVLFADEPTGSLDKETRAHVMGVLTRWLDEKPDERLLIWVTHHDNDPQDNGAQRRLFVDSEEIVFQDIIKGAWRDATEVMA
jgi:ABC-type lipoprotein export system ATPase subunit